MAQGINNPNPTKLEQARRSAGLSRKKLGELAGISDRTIEAYEQRKDSINGIALYRANKLAIALHIKIEDLIEPDEE